MGEAKITVIKNGPLRVQNAKCLIQSKGEDLPCSSDFALCRCGGSSKKPYCDGSHIKNGFSGENNEKNLRNITIAYKGKEITIYDNRNICSHAGYCTGELPSVFTWDMPWIDPDGDTVEKIIAICEKCPSGALSYSIDGGERIFGAIEDDLIIRVIGKQSQGPYVITGKVRIEGQIDRQPETPDKMVLCRCGRTKNKPYCNGDHRFIEEDEEKDKDDA